MRTLVIGDIHGSFRSLEQGLKLADFDPHKDRLICVGDYVDGWNDSVRVVDLLLDVQSRSPYKNIYLLGNHDAWLIRAMNEGIDLFRRRSYIESRYSSWIAQGGEATYAAYLGQDDQKWMDHKRHFFDQLKLYHIENNRLFVHGGFDSPSGFETTLKNNPDALLWDRSLFDQAINQWNSKEEGGTTEGIKFGGFDKIYIGHTPTIKFGIDQPVKMGNVINVDQGCKLNGRLSIWVDELDTFFQVPPLNL